MMYFSEFETLDASPAFNFFFIKILSFGRRGNNGSDV